MNKKISRILIEMTGLLVLAFLLSTKIVAAQEGTNWVQLSPGGTVPEIRYWHGGAYDANSNRMIVFGGGSNGHGNLNDVWVLTHANGLGETPEWINTIPNGQPGSPPSRNLPGTTYDPVSNRLILFGGCGGGCWPILGDVWVLTNANATEATPSQWFQLSPTGSAPAPRDASQLAYDSINNRMILFSGHDGSGSSNSYSDVWVLTNANGTDAATPQWIQISSNIPVAGRYLGSVVYDQQNNRLITFGGKDISANSTNAVWILTNANGLGGTAEWVNLLPENAAGMPYPTAANVSVYDASNNSLITFGGSIQTAGEETIQNAVWQLSNANGLGGTPEWTQVIAGDPAPSPRSNSTAGYDPVNQRLVLFGGHHTQFNAKSWVLDFDQPIALSQTDIFVTGHNGETETPSHGNPMLFRMGKNGNILWEKHLPFTQLQMDDRLADRNLLDDAFYMVISNQGYNMVEGNGVVQKYDAYGNLAWSQQFITNSGWGYVSANPVGGGIYLAGDNVGIYRIDKNGNILWGPLNYGCAPVDWSTWAVAADAASGGAFAANYTCNLVLKIDSAGNEVWRTTIPSPSRLNTNPEDGGVYVGAGSGNAKDTYRLDANGNIQWSKFSFPSSWTYPRTVSPLDGSIYIASGWPSLIAKATMDGTVLWSVTNDDGNGFGYGHTSLAADLTENYMYTGDEYWGNLGISKYSGADGTTLVWHSNPGNYVYTSGYGPQYHVWTGAPLSQTSPPPMPSSFYGVIHISDGPPTAGDTVQVYLPGVTGSAASAIIKANGTDLIYTLDVPGDMADTHIKEGGVESDVITFKINGRVVATHTWHSGTSVELNLHPPKAIPGGSYTGSEGSAIDFNGSAEDWGNDANTYEWDWNNDGAYETNGQTPSHIWIQDGTYPVGLKVTDSQGGIGTATVMVTVNNVAPTATASNNGPVNEGSPVTITADQTDPGTETFEYRFDCENDGSFTTWQTENTNTCTFGDNGSYIVVVQVRDDSGDIGSASTTVTVTNVAPIVTPPLDQVVNEGASAAIDFGSFTDPGVNDNWAVLLGFGDGSQPLLLSQFSQGSLGTHNHSFDDGPNIYLGAMIVTDKDTASDDATFQITVNNVAPTATFNAPTSVNEGTGIALSFTAPVDPSSADTSVGFEYAFDCGSGYGAWSSTSTASCPTTDRGQRSVKGKIKDKDGGVTEYIATVMVTDVLPTNADAGGPYTAIAGQPVTLNGSATCATVDTCTYAWDLDGDTVYDDASGASPTPTWNTVGPYTIHLQVTDEDGNSITDTASVNITPATHSLSLVQGWNLVSFNVQPTSTAIATVLSSLAGNYDLVYAWDAGATSNNWLKYSPTAPGYSNSLNNLDEKMGFWIHMTAADTLNVTGSVPVTTNINLSTAGGGWNLVAYPSAVDRPLPEALSDNGVGTDFSLIYAYHANEPADPWKLFSRTAPTWSNDLTELEPGWGYWIKVSADHTWSVKYLAGQ